MSRILTVKAVLSRGFSYHCIEAFVGSQLNFCGLLRLKPAAMEDQQCPHPANLRLDTSEDSASQEAYNKHKTSKNISMFL